MYCTYFQGPLRPVRPIQLLVDRMLSSEPLARAGKSAGNRMQAAREAAVPYLLTNIALLVFLSQ